MTTPLLWYLNRGTGVTLLVLLSLTTALGVLALGRGFHPLWPRFVTQSLHRALASITVSLLVAHAAVAVIDEYVDIRWWQAIVPVGATYQPLWLGLGTLALDLIALVVVTSLLRHRLPHRAWFLVHLSTYAVWGLSMAHGLGIGTDATSGWFLATATGCAAVVAVAVLVRLVVALRPAPIGERTPAVAR